MQQYVPLIALNLKIFS